MLEEKKPLEASKWADTKSAENTGQTLLDEELTSAQLDRCLEEYGDLADKRKGELRVVFFAQNKKAADFFEPENLVGLETFSSAERLYLLSVAAGRLAVTPVMAESYFNKFPVDLKAVSILFSERQGFPETARDYNLFTLAFNSLTKEYPDALGATQSYRVEQFAQIAERRALAPKYIMGNGDLKAFDKFGKAADGFFKAFDEAEDLNIRGDHYINPDQMFTEEFSDLEPPAQAELLRQVIVEIHNALLFHEVFNSCFTRERVEDDRQSAKDKGQFSPGYNVAHSILYGTYQSVAAFGYPDDYFKRSMDTTVDSGGALEEYPYHRLLLSVLGKLKTLSIDTQKNCDTIIDFWNKNRNPIFGNAVADSLSTQNPSYSAGSLMSALRQEERDKHVFSAILYRLEFGRVGISPEGVRYLERVYDLGEYNDPNLHVRRLTADGEMGIFDEELELIKYFHLGDLADGATRVEAKVLDFVVATLFMAPGDETAAERAERETYLSEFKQHYYKIADDEMFKATGAKLSNLSFVEQGWFLIYFQKAEEAKKQELRNFVGRYGEVGIKTFLSLESDRAAGEKILELAQEFKARGNERDFEALLQAHGELVCVAEYQSDALAEEFADKLPAPAIAQGLLVRAKDILITIHRRLLSGEDPAQLAKEALTEISQESRQQQVVSGRFRKVAELIGAHREDAVDLRSYAADLELVVTALDEAGGRGLLLRAIAARGQLKPIPEIFWRVDRSLLEYNSRFGFDVAEFLKSQADPKAKKVLLELGPGSGQSRAERSAAGLDQGYVDVTLADNIYYAANKLVENIIDWDKLEKQIGALLSAEDRQTLADVLYKLVVIKDGQTNRPDFEYAQDRIVGLTRDPNSIKPLLAKVAPQLRDLTAVPADYAEKNKNGVYEYPRQVTLGVEAGRGGAFLLAKQALAEQINNFLIAGDAYEKLPAFPAGVMVGDFSAVKSIKDGTVDVALGVRSTVYKQGEEYLDLMRTIANKLKTAGVYIDDNVRENFGVRYRIEELNQLARRYGEYCREHSIKNDGN